MGSGALSSQDLDRTLSLMSDQETTDNFWKVWNSYVWPEPQPVTYRLYYHKDGSPHIYTMEDLPGDYIEVTQEIYIAASHNVQVINGELKHIKPKQTVQKLQPCQESGTQCDPRDVCLVVRQNGTVWGTKSHELD